MGALPSQQTVGRVYWRVEADYLPAGASAPITAPCQGTVKIEPLRSSVNLPEVGGSTLGMTLAYQTRFFTLDTNGVIDVTLVADFADEGWDYRVSPMLKVKDDTGRYVAAPDELNRPFSFHLSGGGQVDLADVRVAFAAGSAGTTKPTTTTTVLRGQVANQAALPASAAVGDQYVTTDTYHLWQWTGSSWVDLGPTQSGTGTTSGTSVPASNLSVGDMTV